MVDIYREWVQMGYSPIKPFIVTVFCMHDLFYNDEVLADEQLNRFSLNPEMQHTDENETKFRLYSDYFTQKYP